MAFVLFAPEFYLGKALTENIAANESRKAWKEENWSTMHAFFANMRGMVLRFETTAVKTSLVPSKPSELGRALYKPRPGGVPTPYFEQDAQRAEQIEAEQCRRKHGSQCPYCIESLPKERASMSEFSGSGDMPVSDQVINDNCHFVESKTKQQCLATGLDSSQNQQHTGESPAFVETATLIDSPDLSGPLTGQSLSCSQQLANSPQSSEKLACQLLNPQSSAPASPTDTSLHSPAQGRSSLRIPPNGSRPGGPIPHKPWRGTWPLSTIQLEYAYSAGLIGPPLYITYDELKNQSKTDALVKFLTVWQLGWTIAQIIARSCEHLATTLLEITVLAFAACSVLTYIFLWHKPQDIKVPTYIDALRPITRHDVIQLAARAPVSTLIVREFWLHGVAVRGMADTIFPFTRGIKLSAPRITFLPRRTQRSELNSVTNSKHTEHKIDSHHTIAKRTADKVEREAIYLNPVLLGIGFGGSLFGTVHFIAWSFSFPTPVERLLWRIACAVAAGLPIMMTAIYSGYMHYSRESYGRKREDEKVNGVLRAFGMIMVPIYLLARLYLIVAVFRGLAYSEVSVWAEVTWLSVIPYNQ